MLNAIKEAAQEGATDVPTPTPGAAPDSPAAAPPKRFQALKRLFEPTDKEPKQFKKRLSARGVNKLLDRRTGRVGQAEASEVGQSVALCLDAALDGKGGKATPIGYLGASMADYAENITVEPVEGS